MSVYKEGYAIVNQIMSQQVRIYDDACDYGVLMSKGDNNFNMVKQLVADYRDNNVDIKHNKYSTGSTSVARVVLFNEWQWAEDGSYRDRYPASRYEDVYNVTVVVSKPNRYTKIMYVTITKVVD